MKTTRRSFLGMLGAGAAAAAVGRLPEPAEPQEPLLAKSELTADQVRGVVCGPTKIDVAEVERTIGILATEIKTVRFEDDGIGRPPLLRRIR